ncbi:MAG: DNA-3-methyladenine glycosylase [Verrucomicrobiales bacterium]|nr:DNA-3-methyladenine glycosylase [Verrucomicrobiales bacterium]
MSQQFKPFPRSFFDPPADVVAPRLLGHWLIRKTPAGLCGGPIVEVEAYLRDDPACHAFRGQTDRNRIMFGRPGHAYVYLIYGYHYCVNAVCQEPGIGEAVLIRAIEPAFGHDLMRQRRPVQHHRDLTNGPAKLCEAMEIDRRLDGADLTERESPLLLCFNPALDSFLKNREPVITGTRVGITKAAHLPLRSYLDGSVFVSKRGSQENTDRTMG